MDFLLAPSHRLLKILAALVWYSGGVVLLLKGGSLLIEANGLAPGSTWIWIAILLGCIIGGLKAKFIFSRSCLRNLKRIEALKQPKIWQFYRPVFFLFLGLMITLGASLSRLAHSHFSFLIGVAILDFSIAIALLGSSTVFWKNEN